MLAGLAVNFKNKCKVFFSKGCKSQADIVQLLEIPKGTLPVKYLGLPLFITYTPTKQCTPLADKIRNKIDAWQLSTPSMAGRVELIKSVLHNVVSNWSSYNLPAAVIKELKN